MLRKTQKMMQAVDILTQERFTDLAPDELFTLMGRRRITANQVYSAVRHFGYRWSGGYWNVQFPRWLERLLNEHELAMVAQMPDDMKLKVLTLAKMSRGG